MDICTVWISDHISLPVILHEHDYYQFIYCEKGVGQITLGNQVYHAVPGRAYLVPPMVPHAIMPKDVLWLTEVKFTVQRQSMDESLRQLPPEFELDEHAALRLSLKDVVKEGLTDRIYSYEATNAALQLFLIRLLRKHNVMAEHAPWRSFYFDTPKHRDAAEGSEQDADFAKVIDYIEKHLAEPITLDKLASLVHFEKSYLTARFKELWGVSPIRYVNFLRIERAKELLAVSDLRVTEIAASVGFTSIHYFSRYFKEKEGVTPNAYRQQRQNAAGERKGGK